jgi:hypothetical protein
MTSFQGIINRIKQEIGTKNDYDVAEALEMKRSTLAERKSRDSIPLEEIIRFCDNKNLSYDWVLSGIGPKYRLESEDSLLKDSSREHMVIDKYTKKILELLKDMDEDQKRSTLYYIDREKQLSELIKKRAGEEQEDYKWDGKERRKGQITFKGYDKRKKMHQYN